MAIPNFGYVFSPTFANADEGRRGGSPPVAPQGPIRTINYSLPRVAGAASFSPLVGSGDGGTPFSSAVLESVFKTIFGSDAMGAISGVGSLSGDTRHTVDFDTNTYRGWQDNERRGLPFQPVSDSGADVLGAVPNGGRSPAPPPVIRPARENNDTPDQGAASDVGAVQAPSMPTFTDARSPQMQNKYGNGDGWGQGWQAGQIVGNGY